MRKSRIRSLSPLRSEYYIAGTSFTFEPPAWILRTEGIESLGTRKPELRSNWATCSTTLTRSVECAADGYSESQQGARAKLATLKAAEHEKLEIAFNQFRFFWSFVIVAALML